MSWALGRPKAWAEFGFGVAVTGIVVGLGVWQVDR